MAHTVQPRRQRASGLAHWWRTSLGSALREEEAERLRDVLPRQYCPVGVQLGDASFRTLESVESGLSVYLQCDSLPRNIVGASAICDFGQLPLPARSVDLFVLAHVLEYASAPHAVLREISETVTPDGYVVICGFNPVSLWGLRRMTPTAWRRPPWTGRFYSSGRVQDWLSLLGFELRSGSMLGYGPPLARERLRRHLRFFDRAGDRWWPMLGGVYILVAQRRQMGVDPLASPRRARRRFVPRLVQPVARTPDTALRPRSRIVVPVTAGRARSRYPFGS